MFSLRGQIHASAICSGQDYPIINDPVQRMDGSGRESSACRGYVTGGTFQLLAS